MGTIVESIFKADLNYRTIGALHHPFCARKTQSQAVLPRADSDICKESPLELTNADSQRLRKIGQWRRLSQVLFDNKRGLADDVVLRLTRHDRFRLPCDGRKRGFFDHNPETLERFCLPAVSFDDVRC